MKNYDFLTNEIKPIEIDIEKIGGHPSIEEENYGKYCLDIDDYFYKSTIFSNYFE